MRDCMRRSDWSINNSIEEGGYVSWLPCDRIEAWTTFGNTVLEFVYVSQVTAPANN